MLTIAFTFLALQLFTVSTSATPIEPQPQGMMTIQLNKRSIPQVDLDGVADLGEVVTHMSALSSKYHRGFENYRQNMGSEHPLYQLSVDAGKPNKRDIVASSKTTSTSKTTTTVTLTDENDGSLWQGIIEVGTPPVRHTVDFDTGSADIYLPGVGCTNNNCNGHIKYNPGSSSTSVDQKEDFNLAFGDGSKVSGKKFKDSFNIGGLTVSNQIFGVADSYSENNALAHFPADGLLGLAHQSLSKMKAKPLFQNLVDQKTVNTPVFGVKLGKAGSELHLGGVDTSQLSSDFTYLPVTNPGYWQVSLDGISVNGKAAVGNHQAIVDTGSSYIIGPTDAVNQLYKTAIPASVSLGNGMHGIPCSSTPQISLTFAGKPFAVDPQLFNQGPADKSKKICLGAIMGSDEVEFWVVGDTFLQNVYTQFDVGNNRVDFATTKTRN